MAGKVTRFIMRVDKAMLARWQAEAKERDASVAALITERMEAATPEPKPEDTQ